MERRSQTRKDSKTTNKRGLCKNGSMTVRPETVRTEGWMNHDFSSAEPPVNDHELTSITALITYVAYITKQNEIAVERQFADRFNIPNVKCLPSGRYDDAVRYLVDQVPQA